MSQSAEGKDTKGSVPQWLVVVDVAVAGMLLVFLIMAFFLVPNPTPDQRDIMRLLTSILAGACAVFLSGTVALKIKVPVMGAKVAIAATAGIALFVFTYFVPPYWNPPKPTKTQCIQNPVQRGC